jgi:vancomycin resistance protein VanW
MAIGTTYFTVRRWLRWHLSRTRWAKQRLDRSAALPHVVCEHRTPLFRQLKDVPIQLQQGKIVNLRIALGRMDGICVEPGETFSYWKLIGPPSARRGFVPGMALHNGVLQEEVAGGLCQLSNLLYWMVLHTPLTVVERWRHNYDVFPDSGRTLPFGSGATCFYSYVDLQFRNDNDQRFQLHVYLTDTHLVGEWRSDRPLAQRYQVYEAWHEIVHEPWGGYTRHNELRRRVLDHGGGHVADQFITENHAVMMYQPLLEAGH